MNIDEPQPKVDEAWREFETLQETKRKAIDAAEIAASKWSRLANQLYNEKLKATLRAEIDVEKGTTI